MVAFYDPFAVALSVIVAIFGSLTALTISSDHEKRLSIGGYAGCLACYGGIVMGGSIWAMHFIAMLALHVPVSISYEPWRTGLSLIIPILLTGLSLRVASRHLFGKLSVPAGGLLMGIGISAMHYLGMSAVTGCGIEHDTAIVALAIAISIGAATVALWFVFRKRTALETIIGAIVLGIAIAGMHYTAMVGTTFVPFEEQLLLAVPATAQGKLAYVIAGVTLLICAANVFVHRFTEPIEEHIV